TATYIGTPLTKGNATSLQAVDDGALTTTATLNITTQVVAVPFALPINLGLDDNASTATVAVQFTGSNPITFSQGLGVVTTNSTDGAITGTAAADLVNGGGAARPTPRRAAAPAPPPSTASAP